MREHKRAAEIMARFSCVDIPDSDAQMLLGAMYRRYCDRIRISHDLVPLGDPWKGYKLGDEIVAATADHMDAQRRIHVTNLVAAPGRAGVVGCFVALSMYKALVETGFASDVVGTIHRDNLPMASALMRVFGKNDPRPLGYVMSWKEA